MAGFSAGSILYRSGWTGWSDTTNKAGKGGALFLGLYIYVI